MAALATAGHGSAAQLLGAGAWTLEGQTVRIAVPGMGKKDARPDGECGGGKDHPAGTAAAGRAGAFRGIRAGGSAPAAVAAPVAAAGSVQEAALAHPLVKRAQEIFKAEVRSVVDLRQK